MTKKVVEAAGSAEGHSTATAVGQALIEKPDELYDTAFVPYAIEIGFFTREWNHLHEVLCSIFCNLVRSKTDASQAVWYAVPHDRTARLMLLAAASSVFEPDDEILSEISWLVESIDKFGRDRDNILHSPVSILLSEQVEFIPRWFRGNGSATRLKERLANKKLLDELKRYRAKAVAFATHASNLNAYIVNCLPGEKANPLQPLPDRPEPLDARRKNKGQAQNQQARSK